MSNQDQFRFCPHCGRKGILLHPDHALRCDNCGFVLYLNVATAVGAIIVDEQGRVLLLRRAQDPAKGKLGPPGGFLNHGENAEDALIREVKEETNLEVTSLRYLCSCPNYYPYKGILYTTTDLYYVCTVRSLDTLKALDEVDSCVLLPPNEIDPDQIAFASLTHALKAFSQENRLTPKTKAREP
jgi:ADP-ribose pyrophosphatase YjhB (NUDIX family)